MKEKIALYATLVNVFLAVGKIIIGYLANVSSVIAEGIHSAVDVVSSIVTYVGIKVASKKEDKKHPYGHYKFEVIAGLIVTLILLFTGGSIVYEGIVNWGKSEVEISAVTLLIMVISAILNEIMSRLKIKYGKEEGSVSLISDGIHSRADVFSSIGVLIGIVLSQYFVFFDSLVAVLIGLYIVKESIELGKEEIDSLLDVSAGKEIEDQTKQIIKDSNIELVELKTQKRGSAITANIEISLPSNLTVDQADKICNKLKKNLHNKIDNLTYIAIQVKSHDTAYGYYSGSILQPSMDWKLKRGYGFGKVKDCVCPSCGFKIEHKPGFPCRQMTCPKCGEKMRRG